jgi:hypothetical protein
LYNGIHMFYSNTFLFWSKEPPDTKLQGTRILVILQLKLLWIAFATRKLVHLEIVVLIRVISLISDKQDG